MKTVETLRTLMLIAIGPLLPVIVLGLAVQAI